MLDADKNNIKLEQIDDIVIYEEEKKEAKNGEEEK